MDSSRQQLHPSQQIKYQTLPLSKKNLLLLFQNKKSKICKNYIAELSNQNPKAQKIIKQVLQQIFCQKKTPSATAYFYALVFYKNLLISSQLDYYEDPDFFPLQIHQAIAQICSYNEKESNVKAKGKDYFSYCVKIQTSTNNKENNLESLGNSVVCFAMEILQMMAELYKVDYFSGDLKKPQQSHFYTHYHMYKKRGVIFPNKQDYLYLKQNDVKEFMKNYAQFIAQQQGDNLQEQTSQQKKKKQQQKESNLVQNPALSSVKKSQVIQQPVNISNLGYSKPSQQPPKQALDMDPKSLGYSQKLAQLPQKQLQSKIKGQANFNKQPSSLSQSKPSQIQRPSPSKQNAQDNYIRQSRIQISLSKQIDDIGNTNLNSQQKPTKLDISKLGYDKDTAQVNTNQTKNLLAKINQSKLEPNQLQTKTPIKKQEVNKGIIQQKRKIKENNNVQTNNKLQIQNNTTPIGNLITKREDHIRLKIFEARPNSKRLSTNSKINQTAIIQAAQSLEKQKQKSVGQITHLKLQKSQKSPSNLTSKLTINQLQKKSQRLSVQQLSTFKDLHTLDSNISFSPGLIQRMVMMRDKRKSVPKTQKKFLQNTFHQNSQLSLKLGFNQNPLSKTKKGIQKVPMKTLSSWRYDKNNKKDLFSDDTYKKNSLIYMIRKLKYPQLTIPLIPQYFAPVTLKMYGLRRSALQVSSYSQSSQVFFNNKIIEARLMKPSQGYYVLSLLNISRSTLSLSALNMSGIQYSRNINILGGSITQNHKKALHSGNYLDIKFTFKTVDLNFKFLPFRVEIDGKILMLELPITLLDQCQVQRQIQIEQIQFIQKKYGRIVKSSPFIMNANDLPNFMKVIQHNKEKNQGNNLVITSSPSEDYIASHFTLKMQLEQSHYQNILSCFISKHISNPKIYQLNIIFDSSNEQNQNFAKVMVELLAFLLCQ